MFLIRWLIAAVIVCTVLPWSLHILSNNWDQHYFLPRDGIAVIVGAALGVLLVFAKKPNWLIHTLIHESAHALACLFLGVRIRNFQASDGKGGAVIHDKTGPVRGTIISLAPYTLPLILIPLFIIHIFISDPWYHVLMSGLISFAYVHHLHGLYHNVRLNFWGKQSDLAKAGRPLSIACIASCLALVTAWTIKVLSHS